MEQKGAGLSPRPARGRCGTAGAPPAQPPLLAPCGPEEAEPSPSPSPRGSPEPCGPRCSGRAGCWPPPACCVPGAAAGTAAAPAGTTPAGPPAPARLAATATRTARGAGTAARTTWAPAAEPVSGDGGRPRLGTPACALCCRARCLLLPVSPVLRVVTGCAWGCAWGCRLGWVCSNVPLFPC